MIREESISKLRSLLSKEEKTSILVGKNPDLDSMAGALALYLTLLKAGKVVNITCPTEPLVEHSSLVGINKVSQKLVSEGGDMIIVLPYQKGKIDKISYNIEGDKIHLVVKAGEEGLGFTFNDINFSKSGGVNTGLVLLVAAPNPSEDLAPLFSEEAFSQAQVLSIGKVGQGEFVDSTASSISEIVADILNKLSAPIDIDIAQNLMNGLTFSTNDFQSEKTTPLAFEMAALLLRYGAVRQNRKVKKVVKIEEETQEDKKETPIDWLTPKIYKGGTLP